MDTEGSVNTFKDISRVIIPGGHFLFSIPLSDTTGLSFNAHRIFSKQSILILLPDFTLQDEVFLFPAPGNETKVAQLKDFQYCVWYAHIVKVTDQTITV